MWKCIKSNLIKIFLWQTKISDLIYTLYLLYLLFNVRKFQIQCAMAFTVQGKLPYLDQVGKILPFDVIVSLQVDFP